MLILFIALLSGAVIASEIWLLNRTKWYNNKKPNMQVSKNTLLIDWSGSSYNNAPKSITVLASENWLSLVASQLKDTLQKMEQGDTTSVVLVPSPISPETLGKVIINGIDQYPYTLAPTETIELGD